MSTRENQIQSIIATLHREATEIIRDPIHADIPFSEGMKMITRSALMMKLSSIRQLGPAYLLYPGAQHTRYEHSLGVYAVARQMIFSLLTRGENNASFSFTMEGIHAFLAAALLHDVGHFPYAHALKNCTSPDHEVIGARSIEEDEELRNILEGIIGTSVASVCQIIDTARACSDPELCFYRSLLSGTLDPDKLDYLCRDAFYCGVPYGVQDVQFLLRHIGITEKGTLQIEQKALGALEHLLFSKYLMYTYVYWHSMTRCATAMIKKSVLIAFEQNTLANSDLIHLDDAQFATLMSRNSGSPSEELFSLVRKGELLRESGRLHYDNTREAHRRYSDERERIILERVIAEELKEQYPELKEHLVVLDIPEPVNFESDIRVRGSDSCGDISFHQASTLFSPDTVARFTSSLRDFRLFVPEYVETEHAMHMLTRHLNR